MTNPPDDGPNLNKPSQQRGYEQPGAFGATPPGATPPPYGAPTPPPYGTPPPPPPYGTPTPPTAGMPGAPAGGSPQDVNIGEALSWAWAQFKGNPGPMVVPGIIMVLLGGIIAAVYFVIVATSTQTTTQTYSTGFGGTYTQEVTTSDIGTGSAILGIVLYLLVFVALIYLSASMIAGALRVADGQPVTVATFLKPERLGPVIGTAIVVGLITAVGLVLCVIPGLFAIFLLQFAIFFVIDQRLSLGAALKASSQLARSSVSNSVLTLVVAYVLSYVGAFLCYIGLIVTWPLGQLFYAHCYRRMSGGYVAPAPQS